jgi:hypothetical protein
MAHHYERQIGLAAPLEHLRLRRSLHTATGTSPMAVCLRGRLLNGIGAASGPYIPPRLMLGRQISHRFSWLWPEIDGKRCV